MEPAVVPAVVPSLAPAVVPLLLGVGLGVPLVVPVAPPLSVPVSVPVVSMPAGVSVTVVCVSVVSVFFCSLQAAKERAAAQPSVIHIFFIAFYGLKVHVPCWLTSRHVPVNALAENWLAAGAGAPSGPFQLNHGYFR